MIDRSRLPALGLDPHFSFPRAARRRLDNGLQVWTVEHRGLPMTVFALLVPGGAAEDPAGRAGLAALAGDLLDEGAGGRTAIEIQEALARLGATADTEVGCDATLVVLTVLTRFARQALAVMADIVARPHFDPAEFSRVRDLRLNRLVQLRDLPPSLADRTFFHVLYGAHPYGHLPLGTEAGLSAAVVADVTSLHGRVYRPARAVLVAVGDESHGRLEAQIEEAFGGWRDAGEDLQEPAGPPLAVRAAENAPGRRLAVVDRPGAPQSELRLGHLGVSRRTPDYHALLVLNTILGGQFTSRLNLRLREEKGYTYGARSSFDFRREPGPFLIQVAVETSATADAIADAVTELDALRGQRPATADELDLARAALTRGYPRNFETAEQIARAFVQMALHDLPEDYFETFVPAVAAVDAETVTRVASARLQPSRLLTAIVGDWDVTAEAVGRLGLGEPHLVSRARAEEQEPGPQGAVGLPVHQKSR